MVRNPLDRSSVTLGVGVVGGAWLTSATYSVPPSESISSSMVFAGRLSPSLLMRRSSSFFISIDFSTSQVSSEGGCGGGGEVGR